jgi:hypothetical protein
MSTLQVAPNKDEFNRYLGSLNSEPDKVKSRSPDPQAKGSGRNDAKPVGNGWCISNIFSGVGLAAKAVAKVVAKSYHPEAKLSAPELLQRIVLLNNLINADKNALGNIPEGFKLSEIPESLKSCYSVTKGVFSHGIQVSFLESPTKGLIVAFADRGEIHLNAKEKAKVLVAELLEHYPGNIVLTGHGFGAELAKYSLENNPKNNGRLSNVVLDTTSSLEKTRENYMRQLDDLSEKEYSNTMKNNNAKWQKSNEGLPRWNKDGYLPDYKRSPYGNAAKASAVAGAMLGGWVAQVPGAILGGIAGGLGVAAIASNVNAYFEGRSVTRSFETLQQIESYEKLLDVAEHSYDLQGQTLPDGYEAADSDQIPSAFRDHRYNVVTGIFTDDDTGNKISILKDKSSGGLVIAFAGTDKNVDNPRMKKNWAENIAQELLGVGDSTRAYLQAKALFEALLETNATNTTFTVTGHSLGGGLV